MKKILAFLMALALTVSLMPNVVVPAYAASNGDKANPYALEVGVNTFDVTKKSSLHYFSFTATEAGTLNMTISTNTGRWYSTIGTKAFWDAQPAEQELAAGESFLIGLRVYTDSSDKWGGCAGTITLNVQFTPAGGATEPTEPVTEPTEPETEPTEPETEPTEPEIEPTEPETEPTEPEIEPTEPEIEPTEPSEPEVNYVAQIGEQGYETLAGAFNAAVDGQTVTLLTDLTLGANDTVLLNDTYPSFLVVSDKAVTLDLNGKHITLDMTDMTGTICAIAVDGTGHLTVTDTEGTGSIHGINGKAYSLFTAFVPTAQLTINAGTFELDEASNCLIHSAGSDTVNINGGKFTLGNVGTDVNRSPWIVNANGSNVRHVNINGGSFNANVQDLYWHFEAQLPADKAVSYANGYYTVVDAKVSVTGYKFQNTFHADHTLGYLTLEEAFANAADGATVTLLTDLTLGANDAVLLNDTYPSFLVVSDKAVTLDLNGKHITLDMTDMTGTICAIAVDGTGHLTVTDTEGTGSIHGINGKAYSLFTAFVPTAQLTINAGTFELDEASNCLIHSAGSDTVNINGGKFTLGNVGTDVNRSPWIVNANGSNVRHVNINGGSFNANVQDLYWHFEAQLPADKAVSYANGYYTVVDAKVSVTGYKFQNTFHADHTLGYLTLEEAFANAADGATITLLSDFALYAEDLVTFDTNYSAFFVIEDKTITIDLNGYKLLGYTEGAEGLVVGMFGTINNGHLTLNDSSNGDGVVSITAQGANVYALITNYSNCSVVVNGGNYLLDVASDSLIYTAANEGVIVNGGNFVLGNVGTGKNGMPWIFNAKGQNTAHVLVYGGTFNADVQHQYYPFEVLMPKELALDKSVAGKFTVVKAVAYVTEREWSGKWYTNNIGYATLEEAFAACEGPKKSWNGQWSEQEEVILLSDVTID